jgi:hypothetical protein
MKNYTPTKHNGSLQPVNNRKRVAYRTISDKGSISHIHHPIHAEYLNWGIGMTIGRIYDFQIVGGKVKNG